MFTKRIQNPSNPLKWTFLSVHDTDITALLTGLNFTSAKCIEDLYRKGKSDELNCSPSHDFAASVIF